MRTVAVAGHVCVDLTPRFGSPVSLSPGALIEVGPLSIALGGCVANVTRTLAGLGHPVTAYAVVGDDALGKIALDTLPGPFIESRMTTTSAATSYSLVLEAEGQDRTFWHHTGANKDFDGQGIDLEGIDLLHLGYPPLLPRLVADDGALLVRLLRSARAGSTTTSIDLAVADPASAAADLDWSKILRRAAPMIDVLSPSLDDLTSALGSDVPGSGPLAERFAELLLGWGAAVVTVSAGRDGIVLRTAGRDRLLSGGRALAPLADEWKDASIRIPALDVAAMTTNGAGDAASAGLLYAISAGLPVAEAVALATTCSAVTVQGQIPTLENVALLVPELGRGAAHA